MQASTIEHGNSTYMATEEIQEKIKNGKKKEEVEVPEGGSKVRADKDSKDHKQENKDSLDLERKTRTSELSTMKNPALLSEEKTLTKIPSEPSTQCGPAGASGSVNGVHPPMEKSLDGSLEVGETIEEANGTTLECLIWGKKRFRNTVRMKATDRRLLSLQTALIFKIDDFDDNYEAEFEDLDESYVPGLRRQPSRMSSRSKKTFFTSLAEESSDSDYEEKEVRNRKTKIPLPTGDKAISKSGYTCRGRVKQKAQKRVELVTIGERRLTKGWHNAGYIFPLDFKSRTYFRSSINLDALCIHECEIVKGEFWPSPTFVIVAADRPNERLSSKSCTGCWTLVLKRINYEIMRRRKQGESLPPPPKTAIAGPEYFGLIQDDILRKIESLDPDKKCVLYWAGKMDRKIATENLGHGSGKRSFSTSGRNTKRRIEMSESENEDEADEGEYTLTKWSALGRLDRYRNRCLNRGGVEDFKDEDDNPLPDMIDMVTMQPVVTPAISPFGHVMGMATWRAWLSENKVCPFTRNVLSIEQCTILTKNNIDKYKDKIVHL